MRDYLLLGGVKKYSSSYLNFFRISKKSPESKREEFLQDFFQNFSDGTIEDQKQEFAWIYEARHRMQKINQQLEKGRVDIEQMDLDAQCKTIALQFWYSPFFKAQLFYSSDTEDDIELDAFLSILKNDLQREQLSAQQIAALKVGINVEQLQQLEDSLSEFRYNTAILNGGPQSLPGTWGRDLIDYTHDVGNTDDLKYEFFYDHIKQKLGCLLFSASNYGAPTQDQVFRAELLITLGAEFNLAHFLINPRITEYPLVALARLGRYKSIDQHIRLIDLLLKRGALVNVCDYTKNTALHNAVRVMDARVIKRLLTAGANPNFRDIQGANSLHVFAWFLACIHLPAKSILAEQAPLDMHDENEVLALLLNAGVDINCKNEKGKEAYQLCSSDDSASAVLSAGILAYKKRKDEEETQASIQKNVLNCTKR